jgi:hypothetical protein
MELEDTDVGEFELLEGSSAVLRENTRKPVTLAEWNGYFDPRTGRLSVTIDEVKERVFHGGLDAEDGVRKEAWPFLLGLYDWHSTADERRAQTASLRDEYIKLKARWWERQIDLGGIGQEGESWREQRGRIGKFERLQGERTQLPPSFFLTRGNREGRPQDRPQRSHFRRRGHCTPGSQLSLRRGRDKCPPGADERHAVDLQRVQ